MGVAHSMVWARYPEHPSSRRGLTIFYIQLALNIAWSFLFFGLRSPLLGLVGIVPLWISILLTILEFRKIDGRASLILIPYLLWTSFAGLLNYYVWMLN
jgi:tryptophan-rich sensory protein